MQPTNPALQFERAEFPGAARQCARCKTTVADQYYLLGGHTICASCMPQFSHVGTAKGIGRPLLFGLGGAAAGAAAYAAVSMMTGFRFSLLSILVGFLVGKAVRAGAGGRGGLKLQILAVLLTYGAITLSYIPQMIQEVRVQADKAAHEKNIDPAEGRAGLPRPTAGRLVMAVGFVAAIALAAPFLELASSPGGGLLNALIIFFGLAQAWRMTRGVKAELTGPFQVGAQP
jgi:hypothetical protein